ncbi:MAG: pentapeptide repeat-containing protein, partial [Chroococcales cyanobacterium]
RFHAQYLREERPPRHKIILTSRDRTLEGLTRKYRLGSILPLRTQLRRIAIEPMEQEQWREWFQHWSKLQSKSIAKLFFSLLKQEGLFLKEPNKNAGYLVRQPLMLYLFGILHRDYLLDKSLFNLPLSQLKFEIYDRINRWLLGQAYHTQPLPEVVREGLAHASRSPEAIANLLAGRPAKQLRSQMQQIALQILQTGHWRLTLESESSRGIETLNPFPALFFSMTLPAQDSPSSSAITFSHRNLGEFLAAEEIAQQLKQLTHQVRDRYGQLSFSLESPHAIAEHLYSLLGYGILSREIEELAIERLRQEQSRNAQTFSFKVLFERLYSFYIAYCSGRWFDEGIVHSAYSQLRQKGHCFNTLQVDAAVGINVFLLLCITSRYASIPFFPCGDPNLPQEYDADRLLTFISRVSVLSPTRFSRRVQNSLSHLQLTGACLNRTMLSKVNLAHANLSVAELIGTNLAGANLAHANLSWASLAGANLASANLEQANLEGADLSGANLIGVNLKSTNLKNTCLYQAQLNEDNEILARNNGAIFSLEKFHQYSQSLVPRIHSNNLIDLEFFATEKVQIESLAGQPILPSAWDDTYSNDSLEEDEEVDETLIYYSNHVNSANGIENKAENATIALNNSPSELDDYSYENNQGETFILE